MWSEQMALGSYGLNERASFGQSTMHLESFLVGCFKDLLEQTKVVVQTNPIPGQTKAWDRVDKAGCQTSQTTVTKWWFQFHFFDFDQVFTSIWQFFLTSS